MPPPAAALFRDFLPMPRRVRVQDGDTRGNPFTN